MLSPYHVHGYEDFSRLGLWSFEAIEPKGRCQVRTPDSTH